MSGSNEVDPSVLGRSGSSRTVGHGSGGSAALLTRARCIRRPFCFFASLWARKRNLDVSCTNWWRMRAVEKWTRSGMPDAVVRSRPRIVASRSASQKLSGDAFSRPYAELKDHISFLDWHSRTEIAIAEAALDYAGSGKSAPRLRERPAGFADLNVLLSRAGDFTLFEVPFRSRNLRIERQKSMSLRNRRAARFK